MGHGMSVAGLDRKQIQLRELLHRFYCLFFFLSFTFFNLIVTSTKPALGIRCFLLGLRDEVHSASYYDSDLTPGL